MRVQPLQLLQRADGKCCYSGATNPQPREIGNPVLYTSVTALIKIFGSTANQPCSHNHLAGLLTGRDGYCCAGKGLQICCVARCRMAAAGRPSSPCFVTWPVTL